jgi:hypothetical protein
MSRYAFFLCAGALGLMTQQPAGRKSRHVDTVRVTDTLRLVDTVRVRDTVWVQSGGADVADWFGLALTFGLVVFAGVEILIERKRDRQREREKRDEVAERTAVADALVSAQAYAMRRQLRSWLDEGEPPAQRYNAWAERVKKHFDSAEARMLGLMEHRPHASPAVSRALADAFVLFLQATNRINQSTTAGDSSIVNRDMKEKVEPAHHELVECVRVIDGAIAPDLRDR